MNQLYSYEITKHFHLFSISHFSGILTIVILALLLYIYGKKKITSFSNTIRLSIAIILILQELSLRHWRYINEGLFLYRDLPLELCGISIILSAVMLISNSYKIYEILYFWGFAAATQAILTPDVKFDIPHYRYFQFFLSHGLIILSVCYMTFVKNFRPTLQSYKKSILATCVYVIFIAVINKIFKANYLFICRKPSTASILDFFGPWPIYLIIVFLLMFILFFLVYLPFFIIDLKRNERRRGHRIISTPPSKTRQSLKPRK